MGVCSSRPASVAPAAAAAHSASAWTSSRALKATNSGETATIPTRGEALPRSPSSASASVVPSKSLDFPVPSDGAASTQFASEAPALHPIHRHHDPDPEHGTASLLYSDRDHGSLDGSLFPPGPASVTESSALSLPIPQTNGQASSPHKLMLSLHSHSHFLTTLTTCSVSDSLSPTSSAAPGPSSSSFATPALSPKQHKPEPPHQPTLAFRHSSSNNSHVLTAPVPAALSLLSSSLASRPQPLPRASSLNSSPGLLAPGRHRFHRRSSVGADQSEDHLSARGRAEPRRSLHSPHSSISANQHQSNRHQRMHSNEPGIQAQSLAADDSFSPLGDLQSSPRDSPAAGVDMGPAQHRRRPNWGSGSYSHYAPQPSTPSAERRPPSAADATSSPRLLAPSHSPVAVLSSHFAGSSPREVSPSELLPPASPQFPKRSSLVVVPSLNINLNSTLLSFSDGGASHSTIETSSVTSRYTESGQKQLNQYLVMKELGRGAYGSVKKVMNTLNNQCFAMKMMSKRLLAKRKRFDHRSRFSRDFQAMAASFAAEAAAAAALESVAEADASAVAPPGGESALVSGDSVSGPRGELWNVNIEDSSPPPAAARPAPLSRPSSLSHSRSHSRTPSIGNLSPGRSGPDLHFLAREVAIMKKLDHRNIVRLVEVMDDPNSDNLYMIMELMNGPSIKQKAKNGADAEAQSFQSEEPDQAQKAADVEEDFDDSCDDEESFDETTENQSIDADNKHKAQAGSRQRGAQTAAPADPSVPVLKIDIALEASHQLTDGAADRAAQIISDAQPTASSLPEPSGLIMSQSADVLAITPLSLQPASTTVMANSCGSLSSSPLPHSAPAPPQATAQATAPAPMSFPAASTALVPASSVCSDSAIARCLAPSSSSSSDDPAEFYPLELPVARQFFRDAVAGLDYLHVNRVLHRDIKPDNLLLFLSPSSPSPALTSTPSPSPADLITDSASAAGTSASARSRSLHPVTVDQLPSLTLKISDFGASSFFQGADDVQVNTGAGTAAFMAPEICNGSKTYHGKPADVYSLGACLYVFVTGRLPFQARSLHETYEKIVHEELIFPSDVQLPAEVEHLIRGMMEKNPKQRMTLSEVKDHPWLRAAGEERMPQLLRTTTLTVSREEQEKSISKLSKAYAYLKAKNSANKPDKVGDQRN